MSPDSIFSGLPLREIDTIASTLATILIGWVITVVTKLVRTIKLLSIEVESTDFALEKSLGNGYSKHKLLKKHELLADTKYKDSGK